MHKAIIAGRTRVVRKRDAEAFLDGDVAPGYAGLALFRLAETNNQPPKAIALYYHSVILRTFMQRDEVCSSLG